MSDAEIAALAAALSAETAASATARSERFAAVADAAKWRGFAKAIAKAVYPGEAGEFISDRLCLEDLTDLTAAMERLHYDHNALVSALARAEAAEKRVGELASECNWAKGAFTYMKERAERAESKLSRSDQALEGLRNAIKEVLPQFKDLAGGYQIYKVLSDALQVNR